VGDALSARELGGRFGVALAGARHRGAVRLVHSSCAHERNDTGETTMMDLRFGIEIETVGRTQEELARAIVHATGGTVRGGYSAWEVIMTDGRAWKVVPDGSLSGGYRSGEIVSPILTHADLDTLQKIVREVRKSGAKADATTGIHIHVDAALFDARTAVNLIRLVARQEAIIEKALAIQGHRRARYCRPVQSDLLTAIERTPPKTMEDLRTLWYGSAQHRPSRYDSSRYHGLNLNSLFFRGTCEFRWFEGSLHAGIVKAYVQLVLAIASKALANKSARKDRKSFKETTAKFDMRVFMHYLGMRGDDYETARTHLTKNLPGSGVAPCRRRVAVPVEPVPPTVRAGEVA
jgi:hypothetical protein